MPRSRAASLFRDSNPKHRARPMTSLEQLTFVITGPLAWSHTSGREPKTLTVGSLHNSDDNGGTHRLR
jgi:hypothetical protein